MAWLDERRASGLPLVVEYLDHNGVRQQGYTCEKYVSAYDTRRYENFTHGASANAGRVNSAQGSAGEHEHEPGVYEEKSENEAKTQ